MKYSFPTSQTFTEVSVAPFENKDRFIFYIGPKRNSFNLNFIILETVLGTTATFRQIVVGMCGNYVL